MTVLFDNAPRPRCRQLRQEHGDDEGDVSEWRDATPRGDRRQPHPANGGLDLSKRLKDSALVCRAPLPTQLRLLLRLARSAIEEPERGGALAPVDHVEADREDLAVHGGADLGETAGLLGEVVEL